LMSAANVDFSALKAKVKVMEGFAAAKNSKEQILSIGASYTTTAPNYTYWENKYHANDVVQHRFADDGIRLTDGLKGYGCGSDSRYSAWTSNADIVIDLGAEKAFDIVNVYAACDEWGVAAPTDFSVSYSNNGTSYTAIAATAGTKSKTDGYVNTVSGDNIWGTKKLSFTLNTPVTARYVKVTVPRYGTFLWLDEVEVAKKAPAPVYGAAEHTNIITGVNAGAMTNQACNLYVGPQTLNGLNFGWSACLLAKWDTEKNAYIITQTKTDNGTAWNLTLAADEIFLAAHDAGWYNFYTANQAQVGQVLEISRFDGANGVSVASQYSVYDYVAPHTCTPKDDAWYTNGNTHWKECTCGEHLNESDHDDGAWKVTTPAEVGKEGEKELRCTVCNYLLDTDTIPALTPEHTHTPENSSWQSNGNTHWKECACGEHLNESAHDDGAWETVAQPQIGVNGKKELKCTVCGYVLDSDDIPALEEETPTPDPDPDPDPDFVIGDVNGNGKIDARDYLLLKRAYFGTYTLTCSDAVADINGNGKIDARDYLLLKRAYFGTYEIK
ncbi:MAG: discoidin domain-containing protein, partial [Clostridia bacterium]|nr:discoidin domain-containing protein [Clostridia bacterium]